MHGGKRKHNANPSGLLGRDPSRPEPCDRYYTASSFVTVFYLNSNNGDPFRSEPRTEHPAVSDLHRCPPFGSIRLINVQRLINNCPLSLFKVESDLEWVRYRIELLVPAFHLNYLSPGLDHELAQTCFPDLKNKVTKTPTQCKHEPKTRDKTILVCNDMLTQIWTRVWRSDTLPLLSWRRRHSP